MRKGAVAVFSAFLLLALVFGGAGCSSSSDSSTSPSEPVDVTGVWVWTADGFDVLTVTLALETGDTVAGASTGYNGTASGTVAGSAITLTIVFEDGQTTTFSGTVSGNAMSGTYSGGYPGEQVFTGSWNATRQRRTLMIPPPALPGPGLHAGERGD